MKAYGEKDKRGNRADRFTCCDRVNGCECNSFARSVPKARERRIWRKRARAQGKVVCNDF